MQTWPIPPSLRRMARNIPAVPWLKITLVLAAPAFLFLMWGTLQRPFWYDEVYTLGTGGIFPDLLWSTIRNDVHPPGHLILVSLARLLAGGAPEAARWINLLAVLAVAGGAWRLARFWPAERTLAAVLLVVLTQYTPFFALEARAYILLIGFGFLAHSFLVGPMTQRVAAALGATGLFLASLHFFGTALGGAVILTAFLREILQKGPSRAAIVLGISGAAILGLTAAWIFAVASFGDRMGGAMHFVNDPRIAAGFLKDTGLASAVVLVSLAALLVPSLRPEAIRRCKAAGPLLAPTLLILIAAGAISLHTPVFSQRNTSALVAGWAVFAAAVMPWPVLAALNRNPVTLVLALGWIARLEPIAFEQRQDIPWATQAAFAPECDGAPLYHTRIDGIVAFAAEIWAPGVVRPLREITELADRFSEAEQGACPVIAAGWQTGHGPAEIEPLAASLPVRAVIEVPADPFAQSGKHYFTGFLLRQGAPDGA